MIVVGANGITATCIGKRNNRGNEGDMPKMHEAIGDTGKRHQGEGAVPDFKSLAEMAGKASEE